MNRSAEPLDILEAKINELELKVYDEKLETTESFNSIIDSFIQANTLMSAALSGREKFNSVFKRMQELHNYLLLDPLIEDPTGTITKLNIILSMKDEYLEVAEKIEELKQLREVLDDGKIKNIQLSEDQLNNLIAKHLEKREKLNEISIEAGELLTKFNEVCLEISKSFFWLNAAISKLENSQKY